MDLNAIQKALREFGFDAWLLYDFRGSNPLARRILGFKPEKFTSRRFMYLIPADGEPTRLVHRIEMSALDHLRGDKRVYMRWQELESHVAEMLRGLDRVAMEYSPRNGNPYISMVDGGTVELVKSCGVDVVPSGDLVQLFEATLSPEEIKSHFEVEKITTAAFDLAFKMIAECVRAGTPATETEVQAEIVRFLSIEHQLDIDHAPIVAVGPHSGDPHFEPKKDIDKPIAEGAFVMIDLWARFDRPGAVFSDITKNGFVGESVPEKFTKVFNVVAASRDAGIELVKSRFAAGAELRGFEVDDACRNVIEEAGYGDYFVHRTGHSIGSAIHGNGTHMDNLETHDDRLVLPRTCFSIEPGIYTEEFGVRCEIDVIIDSDKQVHVTGGVQERITPILAEY